MSRPEPTCRATTGLAHVVRTLYSCWVVASAPAVSATASVTLLLRNVRSRLSPEEVGSYMRQYEMMVILDPEVDERTVKPSLEKYLAVVTNDKGTVDNLDVWGRRRLAFPIKKKSDGVYAVINFTAESATAKELERQLGLNETILRLKLLRPDAH